MDHANVPADGSWQRVEMVSCSRCGGLRQINAFCSCVPQHEIDAWFASLKPDRQG